MARNDITTGPTLSNPPTKGSNEKSAKGGTSSICSNCGGTLEPVSNRLFLMYKRARLPQPKAEAWVCSHCGWVEGDDHFQALLEERINHR
ncbi:MAG TPA: hypothetical protein VH186_37050 [Chloroflexia bacterium]|nr:hypothetical protein [Chloroflexia bacterium]